MREIRQGSTGLDIAVFSAAGANYTVLTNADGSITVTDNRTAGVGLLANDGVDTLWGIEVLRFADGDMTVAAPLGAASGTPVISDTSPTEGIAITVNTAAITDPNGLGVFSYTWEASATNGATWTVVGTNSPTFTPTQLQVGRILRVLVSFTDGAGNSEILISEPTSVVGDLLTGTAAANLFTGTAGDDRALGLAGNDNLIGGLGSDTLDGGNGNDSLNGGVGNDSLIGGAGNDTYLVESTLDAVVEAPASGIDTVSSSVDYVLSANLENLTLTGTALSGTGNAEVNAITGTAGNNTLDGGAGNVTYLVDSTVDVLVEAAAGGTDTVISSATYTLGGELENLTLVGAALNGTGNAVANGITGNAANNLLSGLGGNDTLVGLEGDDTLDGGAGVDSLVGGLGNDLYILDAATDVVVELAGGGIDTVSSTSNTVLAAELENLILQAPALTGTGNALANTITGNAGNNTLDGGAGDDTLVGLAGNDSYVVDSALDVIVEAAAAGTDTVTSTVSLTLAANVDNLVLGGAAALNGSGNADANVLTGNAANNQLDGLAGNDTLIGGLGADSLNGGTGNDLLTGGAGVDLFVFNSPLAGNVDTISDFAAGDLFQLDRTIFSALSAGTTLTAAEFLAGAGVAAATNAQQRILHNTTSGALLYDADGNGTGLAVQFASVAVGAPISAAVFTLAGAGTPPPPPPPAPGVINGTPGNDNLLGGASNETLNGLAGNDSLNGAGGNDSLNGGPGSDQLTGGIGADSFLLADAPGATNIDRITDFALGDRLLISGSAYAGLTLGAVSATQFIEVRSSRGPVASATAATRLIFDRDTFRLFHDPDGTGTQPMQQILSTTNGYRFVRTDFTVF